MVAALTRALARVGDHVDVVTPLYRGVAARAAPGLRSAGWRFDVRMGDRLVSGEFRRLDPEPNLTLWFVDRPEYFDRAGIYQERAHDYPDNAERFLFFVKAGLALARHLPEPPAILHAHDWPAAMAPLLVQWQRVHGLWPHAPRTVLTLHNLEFQGAFPVATWPLANVGWDWFHSHSAEFHGRVNFLKAGIQLADALTAVSPRYAREITTREFGFGLEDLLLRREYELTGILNGIDYAEWNAETDPRLAQRYAPGDWTGKAANKAVVQTETGLEVRPDVPLFANISRLTWQKGCDLQLAAVESLLNQGADLQFLLLGTGEPVYEEGYRRFAARWPGRVAAHIRFDEGLAHRIEAGADFYLMPSRFEPCGLNQMYSMRYGATPIVRATGGLDDSVVDLREDPAHVTGVKFHAPTVEALTHALRKALAIYHCPPVFDIYRLNAMHADFSWERRAREYQHVYQQAAHGY